MKNYILLIIIGILFLYIFQLRKLVFISADAMQECRIGTYSALYKPLDLKQKEIQATYDFVTEKEKEFIKLKLFN